jgi:hypothetical protein
LGIEIVLFASELFAAGLQVLRVQGAGSGSRDSDPGPDGSATLIGTPRELAGQKAHSRATQTTLDTGLACAARRTTHDRRGQQTDDAIRETSIPHIALFMVRSNARTDPPQAGRSNSLI